MLLRKIDVNHEMNIHGVICNTLVTFINNNYDFVQFKCTHNGITSTLMGTKSDGTGDVTINVHLKKWLDLPNKLTIFENGQLKTYNWETIKEFTLLCKNITNENRGV